jgi:hypothetical protein
MPLSPRDFSFVAPPTDYRPPNVDFSWLSNLVPDYYKAQLAPLEVGEKRLRMQGLQQLINDYSSGGGGGTATAQPSTNVAAQPSTDAAAQPSAQPSAQASGLYAGANPALYYAVHGNESIFGRDTRTSSKGAVGPMQITQGTFNASAQPGERINVDADNMNVGKRILDKYVQKYGDPARAMVAYFSGEGNVAPQGSPTPWKRNTNDGHWTVQQYVTNGIAKMRSFPGGTQMAAAAPAAAPSGFGADATATAAPAAGATSGYDRNLTPEQARRAGLTPEQVATDRATDAANAPTGVSTAAPEPEEPVGGGDTSPPFAPARTAAAASTNAAGPQNIKLASIAPNVAGLTPTPPSTIVPTSSAEVAGTQGQGIGTRPSGIGPGPMPAANVAARFPGVGEQLAQLIPRPPAPQPSATPQGRDNLSQGPATSTAATTAPHRTLPPNFQKDPTIAGFNAQIAQAQTEAAHLARRAALGGALGMPGGNELVTQKQAEIANLQQQRSDRIKELQDEYGRQRATEEEAIRGTQAAKTELEKGTEQRERTFLDAAVERGTNLPKYIGQLDQIQELGRTAPYGAFTKLKEFLGQYGVETQGLTELQTYQAAIDRIAPPDKLAIPEIAAFRASLGGLLATPGGREIAINSLRQIAQYEKQAADIAGDEDLTTKARIRRISNLAFPKLQTSVPNAQSEQLQPNSPTTKEEYDALKSGARYQHPKDPTGTFRIKP